jgi:hypothetical protein
MRVLISCESKIMYFRFPKSAPALFAVALAVPASAQACACGCSIFDVGTSSLLPSGLGTTLFLEYDFLNQTTNWSGGSAAPGSANDDKKIRSDYVVLGVQHMFGADWGVMAKLPFTHRGLLSADSGAPEEFDHTSLGDARIMVSYSGFSSDGSTGVIGGVKLPTGDTGAAGFEADTQNGTGSTDVMLGAYHTGPLTADGRFSYYGQAMWEHEIATQNRYAPGGELNGALGVSYAGWTVGNALISPLLQAILSVRGRDGGAAGDPANTGYTRVLVSPGVKADFGSWKLYGDAEVALAQTVNGDQLVAPVAFKLVASYAL